MPENYIFINFVTTNVDLEEPLSLIFYARIGVDKLEVG